MTDIQDDFMPNPNKRLNKNMLEELSEETREAVLAEIKRQISENKILIYMKGAPNAPECGFSARAVQVLIACGKPFAYVNILTNPLIRSELPKYADWPTFPQLWVNGELVGGSDILQDMYETGELQKLLNEAVPEE